MFDELKAYVAWSGEDEAALTALLPLVAPELERIAVVFYDRAQAHADARAVLTGGEQQLGELRRTLVEWLRGLLGGPWDQAYYQRQDRIGRAHVRVALPQHYMIVAADVVRLELGAVIERVLHDDAARARRTAVAVDKALDLDLAIMLHSYREDLLERARRSERQATFGQLVGAIGHELRNPLAVMASSAHVLARGARDDRSRKHTERIAKHVAVAGQIVADMLDLVHERPLRCAPISLASLVDGVLAGQERPAGVGLHADGLTGLPPIEADPVQLRQALAHLVDNAVRAVGEAGEVQVSAALAPDQVRITVEDTGPGVSPDIRARLFEPMVSTRPKGVGLGLALVRRIAERHGGTATYDPPPGGGARFVIALPR